jgi:integrase
MKLSLALEVMYEDDWKFNKTGFEQYMDVQRIIKNVGDVSLNKLDVTYINKIKLWLRDKSPNTVNKYLKTFKTLLNYFKKQGRVKHFIPIKFVRSYNKTRDAFITDEMYHSLLTCMATQPNGEVYRDCLILLYETGARVSEILNLIPEVHADFDNNTLVFEKTKTGDKREIMMTRTVRSILKQYPLGLGIKYKTLQHKFKQVKEELGIEDKNIVLHAFRHTSVTNMLETIPYHAIQKWHGHKRLETTLGYVKYDKSLYEGIIEEKEKKLEERR